MHPLKHIATYILPTALFASLFLLANISQANTQHNHSAFKKINISDNITMLQGKGGNLALLHGEQGLVLVDDDYKEMSSALEKTLEEYGSVKKLAYIINTHWHGDHTQGNLTLGQYAPIIAHHNVRKRLSQPQEIKLFKMKSEAYPTPALPSITYQKSLDLHINNEAIELIHFANGHTDGDSIVFFKNNNVVHMGDHFFNGIFPFVDVAHGGNVVTLSKNITQALTMINANTKIIPGHGPLANKRDLERFNLMLIGTTAEVKAMKDRGKTLKQIQATGLSPKWNTWTKGFLTTDTWISIIYISL